MRKSLLPFALSVLIAGCQKESDNAKTLPLSPTNLKATAKTTSKMSITWTDNATNETSFTIERQFGTEGFSIIANVAMNSTSYLDTGLTANATYSYRIFSLNSTGKSPYSNIDSGTTFASGKPATFSDSSLYAISAIDSASATGSNGRLASDGGSTITARGIVCGITPNPTTDLSTKTVDGPPTSSFISKLKGLSSKTLYYAREYATNSAGTAYGPERTFTTGANLANVEIGDDYRGGTVFYILKPGDMGYNPGQKHGLISSAFYDYSFYYWNTGSNIGVGGTDTIIGSGYANTLKIINAQGPGTYAAIISTEEINGFSDWYLPSKEELNQLYLNIGNGATGVNKNKGHFFGVFYWSSSEVDSLSAYGQSFEDGTENNAASKASGYFARAIRSF